MTYGAELKLHKLVKRVWIPLLIIRSIYAIFANLFFGLSTYTIPNIIINTVYILLLASSLYFFMFWSRNGVYSLVSYFLIRGTMEGLYFVMYLYAYTKGKKTLVNELIGVAVAFLMIWAVNLLLTLYYKRYIHYFQIIRKEEEDCIASYQIDEIEAFDFDGQAEEKGLNDSKPVE